MKTFVRSIAIAASLLVAPALYADVYGLNVVGYVNHYFNAGDNLFENPLSGQTDNNLNSIFAANVVPEGTTISLWNPATMSFDVTSTFSGGQWSLNLLLDPGTGARLTTPSAFVNTFLGSVLSHDGGPFADPLTLPPPYAGPNGLFLLGDKSPLESSGTDIFMNLTGRLPNVGEQFMTYGGISTYLGGGNWDSVPTLHVGEAAFLNIGPVSAIAPVPEPSSVALGFVGIALLRAMRRKP